MQYWKVLNVSTCSIPVLEPACRTWVMGRLFWLRCIAPDPRAYLLRWPRVPVGEPSCRLSSTVPNKLSSSFLWTCWFSFWTISLYSRAFWVLPCPHGDQAELVVGAHVTRIETTSFLE